MPLHYDGEVQIYKVPHMSAMNNNGYILRCPNTGEAVIIDTPGEPEKLLNEVGDAKIKAILITHGHGDHIAGVRVVKDGTGKDLGIHQEDAPNLSAEDTDFFLKDGDTIQVGDITLQVMFTPGHTPAPSACSRASTSFPGTPSSPAGPAPAAHRRPFSSWWKASPPVFWSCRRIPTSIPATATTRLSARPKKNTPSSLRSPTRRISTAK